MINYLKRIIEPRGKEDMPDEISLMLWEGYAIVKRAFAFFRECGVRKTNVACEKKSPGIRIQYNSDFYRNHIIEHLLPFWEKYSIDHRYGGFITHLDRRGQIYDDTVKSATMQARMIYAFSVGYNIQSNLNYLNIAKQEVKFLIENLWDHEFGGWYRSVYRDGRVKDTEKQLWVQAYVLLGLVEYYRLTRDNSILKYVIKTHELLDQYGWDKQYLGYYEYCHRNWVVKSSKKTICVQLDLLAAIMSLYYVAGEDVYFNRLKQIANIIVMRMCDKKYGCVMEKFYGNWLYNPIATKDKIQFGHNLKAA